MDIRITIPSSSTCRKRQLSPGRRRWAGKPASKSSFPVSASPTLSAAREICGTHTAVLPQHSGTTILL